MSTLSKEKVANREKTLLTALLLSMWAPITTGIAVAMSRSSTMVADFIRRTAELLALFISWLVFRYVNRHGISAEKKAKLERLAGLSVSIALMCSGIVMFLMALSRLGSSFEPGGNVKLGLAIAILGAFVNGWFWRRYTILNTEHPEKIMESQRQLYRAKTFVDVCVIIALSFVALSPTSLVTRYVDLLGTFSISAYLMWSGIRSGHTSLSTSVPIESSSDS